MAQPKGFFVELWFTPEEVAFFKEVKKELHALPHDKPRLNRMAADELVRQFNAEGMRGDQSGYWRGHPMYRRGRAKREGKYVDAKMAAGYGGKWMYRTGKLFNSLLKGKARFNKSGDLSVSWGARVTNKGFNYATHYARIGMGFFPTRHFAQQIFGEGGYIHKIYESLGRKLK